MKLVYLVGFITKKFVTMYGHMNLKLTIFILDVYSNTILLLNM